MVEAMTQLAYGEYCKAVGGTAFNGDPLPEWKQFSSDAKKTKTSKCLACIDKSSYRKITTTRLNKMNTLLALNDTCASCVPEAPFGLLAFATATIVLITVRYMKRKK